MQLFQQGAATLGHTPAGNCSICRLARIVAILAVVLPPFALLPLLPAAAQGVVAQCGAPTPGHLAMYLASGCLGDAGGITVANTAPGNSNRPGSLPSGAAFVNGGQALALYSGYATGSPYSEFKLGFDGSGNALITIDSAGGNPANLSFQLNGVTYPFPGNAGNVSGPATSAGGDIAAWNNGTGTLLKDTGYPAAALGNIIFGTGLALAPGSITTTQAGANFAVGDKITWQCAGCSATTSPVTVVTAVSGSAIASQSVVVPGQFTAVPPGAIGTTTFTIQSTSGNGTGAQVTGNLGPIAAALSVAALGTGGGQDNGNLFITNEFPGPGGVYSGAESTFIGDRAGSGFTAGATANTALGHNACGFGVGSATTTASFNVCLGGGAGRNIQTTAASNTFVGQSSAGNENGTPTSGQFNTCVGEGNCLNLNAANGNAVVGQGSLNGVLNTLSQDNSVLGSLTANSITSGARNVVLGFAAGGANVGAGSNNVLIGAGCDVSAPNTFFEFDLCFGSATPVIRGTGGAVPSTSLVAFAGSISAGGNALVTGNLYGANGITPVRAGVGVNIGPADTLIYDPFNNGAELDAKVGTGGVDNYFKLYANGNFQIAGGVIPGLFTVAALPTCNSGLRGATFVVFDQSGAPTYRGALTGGGAIMVPAFCNGTSWEAH